MCYLVEVYLSGTVSSIDVREMKHSLTLINFCERLRKDKSMLTLIYQTKERQQKKRVFEGEKEKQFFKRNHNQFQETPLLSLSKSCFIINLQKRRKVDLTSIQGSDFKASTLEGTGSIVELNLMREREERFLRIKRVY